MNFLSTLFGGNANNLDASAAKARIDGEQPPFILDVRQPDEYDAGHIKGAMLIPLSQLGGRLHELPKDKEILCVCFSGSRSGAAVRQLTTAGYAALNLRGGMMGWQMAGYPMKTGHKTR
jgi:rhodanese-related sulfurtransferase